MLRRDVKVGDILTRACYEDNALYTKRENTFDNEFSAYVVTEIKDGKVHLCFKYGHNRFKMKCVKNPKVGTWYAISDIQDHWWLLTKEIFQEHQQSIINKMNETVGNNLD